MNEGLRKYIFRMIVSLLILLEACGVSPMQDSSPEDMGYRYDDLPVPGNESAAFAEYQAISKWSRLDITYHFINGTDKLEGETEWELVRQAFDLWTSQTPLTFTEVADEGEAGILIGWASGEHGDCLGDGVEVMNRMNPLDPDMDRDGISDGQEVAQGSDPFFPEQSEISPELEEDVSNFLTTAIELEIEAYRTGSAEAAAPVMAGDVLATLESSIASLNQQGLVVISAIDYYQSFISDIRVINNTTIEVNTCEVWSTSTYSRTDGQLISSDGPALTPQTLTIQQLDSRWYITNVEFFNPPAFC